MPIWAILERRWLLRFWVYGAWFYFYFLFFGKSLKMPAERLSGGSPWRGSLRFLNQTSKCYFWSSAELGPKKESAYDIYISNLQSLISFDSYLFICKKKNLNQTERHKSKTFECCAKLIKTGSRWVEWNTINFREKTMKLIRLWWEKFFLIQWSSTGN